jgi:hypothetical protein|tara:strand:+ start:1226 stop:1471 length:246 start_codon:yes stop_codon:yes gene_type:complete
MAASIKVFMKDEEVDKPIVGIPQVPKKVSKQLSSQDGTTKVYFVDKNYGLSNGLKAAMNFSITHPMFSNMCEIKCEIERVD